MILPNKYISFSESIIGVSSIVLSVLKDKKMTLDELWDEFISTIKKNGKLKYLPTYNKFALAVNFMYLSKMINYNEKGVIFNENFEYEDL